MYKRMKRFKKCTKVVFMTMLLTIILGVGTGNTSKVYATEFPATESEGSNQSQQENNNGGSDSGSDSGSYNSGISNWVRDYDAVTDENMAIANQQTSWLQSLVGNLIGVGIIGVFLALSTFTVLDLLAIVAPPIRPSLTGQMGGRQWVSDECMRAISEGLGGAGGASAGGMKSPMGGMGSPMGGMGMGSPMGGMGMGSPMGGMNNMQQGSQGGSKKNTVFAYFRHRLFAIVLIAICAVVLTSSVITGCGINIAQLFLKIIAGLSF